MGEIFWLLLNLESVNPAQMPCPPWLLPPVPPQTTTSSSLLILIRSKSLPCCDFGPLYSFGVSFFQASTTSCVYGRPARKDETSTFGLVPGTVLTTLCGTLSAFQIPSSPPSTPASCIGCSGLVPHPFGMVLPRMFLCH
jgi:hypothetical protein